MTFRTTFIHWVLIHYARLHVSWNRICQFNMLGKVQDAQFGHISAAPVSITLNEETSSEWAIVLQPESQQISTTHLGDSGSWVLRQSDNALVGLLWGWVDGHLLFTPIKDVFNDIKSMLNADMICLPGAQEFNSNALKICCLNEHPRQSEVRKETCH